MTLYSKAKRIFLQKKYTFYWTNLHILNSSFHAIFILFLSWFWNAIHFKLLYHYQTSKFWEISFNKKAQWGKNEPSSLAIRMFAWKNVVFDADIMTWLNDKKGWFHSLHTDSHKRDVKSISLENNFILCRKSISFYTKTEKKVACNNMIYHLNTILPTALTLKRAIHSECPFLKNGNERSEWKWKNMNVKIVSKNNVMLCNLPQFYDLK